MQAFTTLCSALVVLLSLLLSTPPLKGADAAGPAVKWVASLKTSSAIGYGVSLGPSFFVQAQDAEDNKVTLYSFDKSTGILKWSRSTPSSTGLYVAAGDDLVFAGTNDTLTAYDASTGFTVWSYTTKPADHSARLSPDWPGKPTYMLGVVYVTWYNTRMYAFNASTGAELFETSYYVGGRIWPVQEQNSLYFMSQEPATQKYSASVAPAYVANSATQAEQRWTTTWEATGNFDTCVANQYGMASRVFTQTNKTWHKEIRGLDPKNGSVLWSVNGTGLTADGGFDYNIMRDRVCGSWQNTQTTYLLTCVNITTGREMWSTNLPTVDNSINVAAGNDFVLVYGYNSGAMFAFDYHGLLLWTANHTNPWYGSVVDDTYIFGHFSGNGDSVLECVSTINVADGDFGKKDGSCGGGCVFLVLVCVGSVVAFTAAVVYNKIQGKQGIYLCPMPCLVVYQRVAKRDEQSSVTDYRNVN